MDKRHKLSHQVRDRIQNAEELWSLKDTLRAETKARKRLLAGDPMFMNRTKFVAYCKAWADQQAKEMAQRQLGPDVVLGLIKFQLYTLDRQWRDKAKELATA